MVPRGREPVQVTMGIEEVALELVWVTVNTTKVWLGKERSGLCGTDWEPEGEAIQKRPAYSCNSNGGFIQPIF